MRSRVSRQAGPRPCRSSCRSAPTGRRSPSRARRRGRRLAIEADGRAERRIGAQRRERGIEARLDQPLDRIGALARRRALRASRSRRRSASPRPAARRCRYCASLCCGIDREHRLPRGERLAPWPPCARPRWPSSPSDRRGLAPASASGGRSSGSASCVGWRVGRSSCTSSNATTSVDLLAEPARRVRDRDAILVLARVDVDDLADRIGRVPGHDAGRPSCA